MINVHLSIAMHQFKAHFNLRSKAVKHWQSFKLGKQYFKLKWQSELKLQLNLFRQMQFGVNISVLLGNIFHWFIYRLLLLYNTTTLINKTVNITLIQIRVQNEKVTQMFNKKCQKSFNFIRVVLDGFTTERCWNSF